MFAWKRVPLVLYLAAVQTVACCLAIAALGEPAQEPTVSLALDKAPLTRLCAELSRQTGVTHRTTGADAERQRVVVYCREQHPAAIRAAVSRLLGWTWAKGTQGGEPGYILMKSAALRRQEAELRQRSWREYATLLSRMVETAGQEKSDWPKPGSSLALWLKDPVHRGVLQSFAGLPDADKEAVLQGRPFTARVSTLHGGFGTAVQQITSTMNGNKSSYGSASLVPTDQVYLGVLKDPRGRPDALRFSVLRGGKTLFFFDQVHYEMARTDLRDGDPQRTAAIQRELRDHPELRKPLPNAQALVWPKPPESQPSYIGWQARDLSRRVSFPVLADCYPQAEAENNVIRTSGPPWPPPNSNGRTLFAVLQDLADPPADRDWTLQDGWILLRYRDWYWEAARPAAKPTASR